MNKDISNPVEVKVTVTATGHVTCHKICESKQEILNAISDNIWISTIDSGASGVTIELIRYKLKIGDTVEIVKMLTNAHEGFVGKQGIIKEIFARPNSNSAYGVVLNSETESVFFYESEMKLISRGGN